MLRRIRYEILLSAQRLGRWLLPRSLKDNFDMLWQPLECRRHGTNEYYFFMQILLEIQPLVIVVAVVTGCQVGLAPLTHRRSTDSASARHLRDILLSKTNDFHLIYFRCLF